MSRFERLPRPHRHDSQDLAATGTNLNALTLASARSFYRIVLRFTAGAPKAGLGLRRIRQKPEARSRKPETECNCLIKLDLQNPILRFKRWRMVKKQISSTNVAGIAIALIVFLASNLMIIPSADAQNTWDGGGTDSNWGTPDNWDDNVVPAASQPLTFAGSTRLASINDTLSREVNGFTFAALAGAFTLSGNAITLAGDITNSSANTQTINLDMVLSGARTITPSASGAVTLGGNISGTGSFTTPSTSSAPITLSGNNSFSGGFSFLGTNSSSKLLNLGHANALGTGLFTWNAVNSSNTLNSLNNTSGSALTIANDVLLSGSQGRMTFVGTNDLTFTGNVTNSQGTNARRFQVDAGTVTFQGNMFLSDTAATGRNFLFSGAGNTTVSGLISNYNGVGGIAGGISVTESATLALLNSSNTYTGPIILRGNDNNPTLIVTKLADGGLASSIGASSNDAANLALPNIRTNATLRYIGSGDSTDRLFSILEAGGVFKIESSGTGALHFTNTGDIVIPGTTGTGRTVELGGTYTGGVNTMASNVTGERGALRKEGAGTWNLTNTNSYALATTVNAGTLLVSGTGSINSSTGITVDGSGSKFSYTSSTGLSRNVTLATGGGFFHSGSTNYSGTLTWTNGTLGGTNWNGNLNNQTVNANRTISPGNSPGTAVTGDQTWGTSGSYIWEINDATGAEGVDPGWDLVSGTGTLTISAMSGNPFTIDVTSLTALNISGIAVNFNAASNYEWRIADFADPVSGFFADRFAITTGSFTNTFDGTFGVVLGTSVSGGDNTQIYLTYTAIPEPRTTALLLGGLCVVAILLRRHPRTHKALLLRFGLATLLLRRRAK